MVDEILKELWREYHEKNKDKRNVQRRERYRVNNPGSRSRISTNLWLKYKNQKEVKFKALIIIDMDLIKELRLQGRYDEVDEILANFHKKSKEEKIQLRKELKANDRKIKVHIGLCDTLGCKNKADLKSEINKRVCSRCKYNRKKSYKKLKKRRMIEGSI